MRGLEPARRRERALAELAAATRERAPARWPARARIARLPRAGVTRCYCMVLRYYVKYYVWEVLNPSQEPEQLIVLFLETGIFMSAVVRI